MNNFVTNPIHGGKITCHECGSFIKEGEDWFEFCPEAPGVYFHVEHFNRYKHYYGLDKPAEWYKDFGHLTEVKD